MRALADRGVGSGGGGGGGSGVMGGGVVMWAAVGRDRLD